MKKLLILTKNLDGGTGTFVLNLQKLGKYYRIHTLALEKPRFRTINSNLTFYQSTTYPQKYSLSNTLSFFKELSWVKRQIDSIGPDVILSVDIHANLISLILKKLYYASLPLIITTHINLKPTLLAKSSPFIFRLLSLLIAKTYDLANIHVCVSKKLAQQMTNDFSLQNKPLIIYNGIPLPSNQKPRIKSKNLEILSIARLVEQKDHATLLQAFALLQKELPHSKLVLLSDGPLRSKLEKLAHNLDVDKSVTFTGWVKDTAHYLNKTDVFILSSNREGFGYVLVEAMSYALPTISTKTPHGPAEILENGRYGLLVPNRPQPMSQALLSLLTDPKLYHKYSTLALQRSKDFSLEKMLVKYQQLIDKLAS